MDWTAFPDLRLQAACSAPIVTVPSAYARPIRRMHQLSNPTISRHRAIETPCWQAFAPRDESRLAIHCEGKLSTRKGRGRTLNRTKTCLAIFGRQPVRYTIRPAHAKWGLEKMR